MHWLSLVNSIIVATFRRPEQGGTTPPSGLEGSRVRYVSEGRSGKVVFSKGTRGFELYYEFGGDDTLAIINVPTKTDWTKRTGFPLEMRQAILGFIGAAVVKDQAAMGQGRYEIHDDHLRIVSQAGVERA